MKNASNGDLTPNEAKEEDSKIYLFEDRNMPLHGGIALVERGSSEFCLKKWRAEQDKNPKQVKTFYW